MKIANIFHACYSWVAQPFAGMVKKTNKTTFEFAALNPNERLRELILFITKRQQGDRTFGATKLNKILFFSDFLFYFNNGESITGTAYRKDEFGPVPAKIETVLNQMELNGDIKGGIRRRGLFNQKLFEAKREANMAIFTDLQIAQVESVIKNLTWRTSGAVSELSHTRIWRVARQDELIPYEAAFLSDEPPTNYEIKRTKKLCSKYGWQN
jgi:hypothetical protein